MGDFCSPHYMEILIFYCVLDDKQKAEKKEREKKNKIQKNEKRKTWW